MSRITAPAISREAIEEMSRQLLSHAGVEQPPVDLNRVTKYLGVRVQKTDLGPDCSGALVRGSGSALIGIHWAHHPNRQRFSLAHELGHYQLHQGGQYIDRDVTVRFRDDKSGTGTDTEERQANQFAAALLMPEPWLRDAFASLPFGFGDDTALDELAALFGVSTQAMSFRLADLKLLRL